MFYYKIMLCALIEVKVHYKRIILSAHINTKHYILILNFFIIFSNLICMISGAMHFRNMCVKTTAVP